LSGSLSEPELAATSPSLLTTSDREAVAEIVTLVAHSLTGGCIYFAVCNNRLKVHALESAIASALSPHGIELTTVTLAERDESVQPPSFRVHIPFPTDYFEGLEQSGRRLYSVRGLPELIAAQAGQAVSGIAPAVLLLNYRREIFRDRKLCVLFWLNPETLPYLMNQAPDFWSFRSGTAQFEERPVEAAGRSREDSGWQTSAPSTRWLGDLDEKLSQLAFYRQKSPPDESAVGSLLVDIGRLRVERLELQQAFEALDEAEEIFERLADRRQLRNARTWLSRAYYSAGRLDRAEEYVHAAIILDEASQDGSSLAADYNDLSQICKARGRLEEAEKWLRKTIEIDGRLANEASLATRYNNLGAIYKARGELEEAEKWLRKAIEIGEQVGDEPSLAIRYNNLGLIYHARGQQVEAEKWIRKAIEIGERLGDEPNLPIRYNSLGMIYHARGQLMEAEKWVRQAIEIAERLRDEPKLAGCYNNLSLIYQTRGEQEEAESWLRKAIEIVERLGDEPHLAVGYSNLSQIYKARGQLEEAEKWLRKAIALIEPKGSSESLAKLNANLEALLSARQAQAVSGSSPRSE